MKQVFSKIASFLLALLVLFSTFSFTVEKHYCGDSLMDVSFIGNANDCGLEMQEIAAKTNCCKNEIHQIKGQDQLRQTQVDDFDFSKQQFLASFYISFNDLFLEQDSKEINYNNISPPEILLDYQVIYQSFLI